MERKPRAYLVNNKGFDMTGAQVYGDLCILYDSQPQDVFSTSKHAFTIKQRLADMQSSDYLVVGGNMILVLLAFGVIYERFGYVNLLLFDVRTQEYTPRVVPKHQLQGAVDGR
jgi:hypothetical protein